MSRIRAIWAEAIGLFVDDGALAVAVLAWTGIAWLALPRLDLPEAARPLLLFAGFAAILLESVLRAARRGKR